MLLYLLFLRKTIFAKIPRYEAEDYNYEYPQYLKDKKIAFMNHWKMFNTKPVSKAYVSPCFETDYRKEELGKCRKIVEKRLTKEQSKHIALRPKAKVPLCPLDLFFISPIPRAINIGLVSHNCVSHLLFVQTWTKIFILGCFRQFDMLCIKIIEPK